MPRARSSPQPEPQPAEIPVILTEVDFKSIEELIERDPRKMTSEEMNLIVAFARQHRELWMEEERNPTGKGGGKKRKFEIKLDELDLDI